MVSGKDRFLYEDDLDAILAIINADMFENDEDMKSEIVTCIENLLSRENCSFKCEFDKSLSIQSKFIKAQEYKTSTAHYPW